MSQIKVILFDIYSEESCRLQGKKEIYTAAFIPRLEWEIKCRLHHDAVINGGANLTQLNQNVKVRLFYVQLRG